jgi:hypothetical protein
MRIYNITQENSKKSLWFDLIFMFLITLIPFSACIFDFNLITFSIFFLVIIIDIIFSINLYKKRKEYDNTISYHKLIDYIDFENDRIIISAKADNGEERFIKYSYDEILSVNIELETYDSCTTRKHYTAIRDIAVKIQTNDDSDYVIHSYNLTFGGNLKTLYNIIDYCRKTQNYNYTLKGTGDKSEIVEKLDFYIKHKRKLRVEHSGRKDLKLLSIIVFIWGCAISIITILPFGGAKGTIISCITFGLIAYLMYFPVILDKSEEE